MDASLAEIMSAETAQRIQMPVNRDDPYLVEFDLADERRFNLDGLDYCSFFLVWPTIRNSLNGLSEG